MGWAADRVAIIPQVENPVTARFLVPGYFAEQILQNETALMGERASGEKPQHARAMKRVARLQGSDSLPQSRLGEEIFRLVALAFQDRRHGVARTSRVSPNRDSPPQKQTTCGSLKSSSASSIFATPQHPALGYEDRLLFGIID